jgi:hypothetical protein
MSVCSTGAPKTKNRIKAISHCRNLYFQGISGAGEGNRTLVFSLGSCCSTIELHPRQAGGIGERREDVKRAWAEILRASASLKDPGPGLVAASPVPPFRARQVRISARVVPDAGHSGSRFSQAAEGAREMKNGPLGGAVRSSCPNRLCGGCITVQPAGIPRSPSRVQVAGGGLGRGRRREVLHLRQHHRVDDMDDAVRLFDISDGHMGFVAHFIFQNDHVALI